MQFLINPRLRNFLPDETNLSKRRALLSAVAESLGQEEQGIFAI